jgi:hypothetical protein
MRCGAARRVGVGAGRPCACRSRRRGQALLKMLAHALADLDEAVVEWGEPHNFFELLRVTRGSARCR